MISRSVAQIATASIRTRTSARVGTGKGLSRRNSSSGPPRTQAFICSGIGKSAEVVTPAGRCKERFPGTFSNLSGGDDDRKSILPLQRIVHHPFEADSL